MYQVYTHPKYTRYGKQFFEGVNRRYTEYAKSLEPKLGIPYTTITPLIFILIQASVHYAMFEDECYLQSQLEALKQAIRLFAITARRTQGPTSRRKADGSAAVPQEKPNKTKRTPSAMAEESIAISAFGRLPLASCGRIRSRCD